MKLSNKALVVIGASLTVLGMMSSNVQARDFGDIYMECGLGAAIFKKNPTMAAISNVTWDLGTTAILSNASSAETACKGSKVVAATFINDSYITLEQDIAKGEGQHLSALMDIMSCDASARAGIVNTIRADFGTAASKKGFAESSQYNKSETLYNIMNSSKVSASCST
ncbi:MAG: DUF3015 family protein [Thiotrichaceae bacterium]|nr:DUF3015 family protein [Thiotrichaceae bacterium]